jgi:3-methyladenine DNA glycosylase/8-oxoguanine DNA glycosylase
MENRYQPGDSRSRDMMTDFTTLALAAPQPYTFSSVIDHGWAALAPCRWDADTATLERVERLDRGEVVLLRLQAATEQETDIAVEIEAAGPLQDEDLTEIAAKVRRMLKLDEDLSGFYARAQAHPAIGPTVWVGRGRLLRSPTLFEDTVKTICTTNITWSQTKAMVMRLVDALGDPYPGDPTRRAFPTAAQVAAAEPAFFDAAVRMGYRNAYVRELARGVVDGSLALEELDATSLPPAELRKALKRIKGVGDYAANTLMMIVGHYGHLAVDSEFRAFVRPRYFGDAEVSDRDLAAVYDDWDDWKYLAYWFDNYYTAT